MENNLTDKPGGSTSSPTTVIKNNNILINGGRFDFDDGGTYCGGWEDGKAHGHGVCTGPKGQGEYSGSWHYGFEVSGVYTWPSGSTYEGQWQNGKRHGLGTEFRGRWTYRGEWTQGFKGRYGVREARTSSAKYEGTWANGLQDGYGSETYADGGTYQGQWLRGLRHGYGTRTSAPFGMANQGANLKASGNDNGGGGVGGSMISLSNKSDSGAIGSSVMMVEPTSDRDRRVMEYDMRGGFVLKAKSDEASLTQGRRRSLVEKSTNIKDSILKGLKLRKQRSTGDLDKKGQPGGPGQTSFRSTGSSSSWMSNDSGVSNYSHHTDSNASFVVEDLQLDSNVTETYMGEWKNDKRSGFGISERSDGLKYEGEWYNNKKYGYGVTTFKDGSKEEGKYKNNILITSQKKKHLFLIRSAKFAERIDAAVNAAQRASKISLQKADISISRTATARGKGEQAEIAAAHSREDSETARVIAKQFAPDFNQPGTESMHQQQQSRHQKQFPLQPQQPQQQQQQPPINATNNVVISRVNSIRNLQGQPMLVPNNNNNSSYSQPPLNQQHHQQQQQQQQQPYYNYSNPDRNSIPNENINKMYPQQQQQQQLPILQPQQQQHAQLESDFHYNYYQPHGGGGGGGEIMGGGGGGGNPYSNPGSNARRGYNPNSISNQNLSHLSQYQTDYYNDPQQQQQSMYQQGDPMIDDLTDPYQGGGRRGREMTRRGQHQPRSMSANPYAPAADSMISDHFDHYKRPPSREASCDRVNLYNVRSKSKTRGFTPERFARSNSKTRGFTDQQTGENMMDGPVPGQQQQQQQQSTHNFSAPISSSRQNLAGFAQQGGQQGSKGQLNSIIGGSGGGNFSSSSRPGSSLGISNPNRSSRPPSVQRELSSDEHFMSSTTDNQNTIESLLGDGPLSQEIPPSPYIPMRTESLFLKPNNSSALGSGGGKSKTSQPSATTPFNSPSTMTTKNPQGAGAGAPSLTPFKRKKSLPDPDKLPNISKGMSREEIASLGSKRRQQILRDQEEAERMRASPILYYLLNSFNLKNWLSRQKLLVMVLVINFSLAIMFLQLLS